MTSKKPQLRFIKKVTRLLETRRYYEATQIIQHEAWISDDFNRALKLLESKRYNDALKIIKMMTSFRGGRRLVELVLRDRNVPKDVQEVVFQKFLDAQKNYSEDPSHWEHDLRAVTPIMWELRLVPWLEKFYLAVFQKVKDRLGSMYEAELVHQFAVYAIWSDDPAKFGISANSFPQDIQLRESSFVLDRLKLSPFSSEIDYLLWLLASAVVRGESLEGIHSKLMKLSETTFDTRKTIQSEKKIIKKRTRILIKRLSTPLDSRVRLAAANDMDLMLKFLMKLAFDEKHSYKKSSTRKGLPHATEKKENHSNRG